MPRNRREPGKVLALVMLSTLFSAAHSAALNINCDQWLSRIDADKVQYEAYVIGMLNGMNNVWNSTYFVREMGWEKRPLYKAGEAERIFLYLDNHCKKEPTSKVVTATYELWTEIAKRP
jgi:hypothetical protein